MIISLILIFEDALKYDDKSTGEMTSGVSEVQADPRDWFKVFSHDGHLQARHGHTQTIFLRRWSEPRSGIDT